MGMEIRVGIRTYLLPFIHCIFQDYLAIGPPGSATRKEVAQRGTQSQPHHEMFSCEEKAHTPRLGHGAFGINALINSIYHGYQEPHLTLYSALQIIQLRGHVVNAKLLHIS